MVLARVVKQASLDVLLRAVKTLDEAKNAR